MSGTIHKIHKFIFGQIMFLHLFIQALDQSTCRASEWYWNRAG